MKCKGQQDYLLPSLICNRVGYFERKWPKIRSPLRLQSHDRFSLFCGLLQNTAIGNDIFDADHDNVVLLCIGNQFR